MAKYALILTTTKNATIFRSTKGFYYKHIHDLEQAGYEIFHVDINNITSQLASLPPSSVGFFWNRMHGSADSMSATKELDIDLQNYADIFINLTNILTDDAVIFLDSCSTGYLKSDLNNMQFAFAKLTLEKPDVQIVAPTKDAHVSYFSVSANGCFDFEILEEPNSSKNIAAVLGKDTKTILSEASFDSIPLESIKERILSSLYLPKSSPFLTRFRQQYSRELCGASFDLTSVLANLIKMWKSNSNDLMPRVRELMETYHANPNFDEGYLILYSLDNATPLSVAVHNKFGEVVDYLLNNGADLFLSDGRETIYEYAKRRDEEIINAELELDFPELVITTRRLKEKDTSKMATIIDNYLSQVQEEKFTAAAKIKKASPLSQSEENHTWGGTLSFWTAPEDEPNLDFCPLNFNLF